LVAVALLAAACAQQAPVGEKPVEENPGVLPPLPATFVDGPECPGCLAVTLTLRPDGSYLVRDQLGASEFYDFGRWRFSGGILELAGERDARRYALHTLTRAPQLEALRGPFRMVGLYDGASFRECRTGIAWRLSETRAAQTLKDAFLETGAGSTLVALDAQFEGSPEALRVLRPATLLKDRACPG